MTNEMVLERTSSLVMPSNYVELYMDEMSYVDGGAWLGVVGWICQGIGLGLGIASSAVSMAGGDNKVAGGLAIAGALIGFIGSILTGIKVKK